MSVYIDTSNHEKDRSLRVIATIVVAFHICAVLWLVLQGVSASKNKPRERFLVQTITISERKAVEPVTLALNLDSEVPDAKAIQDFELESKPVEREPQEIVDAQVQMKKVETKKAPSPKSAEPKKAERPKPVEQKKAPTPKSVEQKKNESPKAVEVKKAQTPKPAEPKKAQSPKKVELKKPTEPAKAQKKEMSKKQPTKPPKEETSIAKIDPIAEAAKEKQNTLFAKAQESIAKIDQSRGKISTAKSQSIPLTMVPSSLESLSIDARPVEGAPELNSRELGYRDELANRLKLLLKLPEHGEVKIQLTLARTGKVVKAVIVASQSHVNRDYVEKTVPKLTFPNFGNNFGDLSEYTFLISLRNE